MDEHAEEIRPILDRTYGAEAAADWLVDWRLFFLICAETWAYGSGQEYGVSHYLLAPQAVAGAPRRTRSTTGEIAHD